MVRYKLYRDVEAPVPKRGRRAKWDLPLEQIEEGDLLQLEFSEVIAKEKIAAVRSHVNRQQKYLPGAAFSVYLNDSGIAIYRRRNGEDDE